MTTPWAAFESALSGQPDASKALDSLAISCMDDIQEMLERIGAGEVGSLLTKAQTAESQERRAKLAASLEIIDDHLPVGRVTRLSRFSRRYVWVGEDSPNSDMVGAALLASLMTSELGGDLEALRTRFMKITTWWEPAIAADLNGLSKSDRGSETSAARRVLQYVMQLALNEMQQRRIKI